MKNLEIGKHYLLKLPGFNGKKVKTHIDYILENKINYNDDYDNRILVYRVWIKHKRIWHIGCITIWELEIYNKRETKK